MANTFITLGGLKLEIRDEGVGGQWDGEDTLRMTLNGKRYKSLGVFDERATYDVNVKYVPDSGFAGYAQLFTWASDRTAANQSLTLIDEFGTNRGAWFVESVAKPKKISIDADGAAALYRATLKLAKA